jgi:diguanylate cyclase (GGDEF)-like protein
MREPRIRLIAVVALLAAMVGGLAYVIAHGQAAAREHVAAELGRRVALAAKFTGGALGSGGSSSVAQQFSGPPGTLPRALAQWEQVGPVDVSATVIDSGGRPLARWPRGARSQTPSAPAAMVREALKGASLVSDLVIEGPRQPARVWTTTPFATRTGERALVTLTPAAQLASFAQPYLRAAPAVPGARAYLIDGHGLVIGSSQGLVQGARIPDPGLASAARSRRSGELGARYWVAAAVGDGTTWRVLFSVPRNALFAPAESSNGVAWMLFAGFVLALAALTALAFLWIRRSAELGVAQERERAAHELAHERLHDSLTSLPNRAMFADLLESALRRAAQNGRKVAVLAADIDNFKRINDSLGHAAGDELLALVAGRLRAAVRELDTVSRFGADEFMVLCDSLRDEAEAQALAARVMASLTDEFRIGGRSVHVTCGIGIAVDGGIPPIEAATLTRDADAALNRAKRAGEARVQLFEVSLHDDAVRRLETEAELRDALRADAIRVHYQPIVSLPDGAVRGVEALARWQRPDGRSVPPLEFIPLAEHAGLIGWLGRSVLDAAVRDVSAWHAAGLVDDDFVLSVNVSPRQLADLEFPAIVEAAIGTWPLRRSSLWLELTESAIVTGGEHDPESFELTLARLAQLGVCLAIDDFGVGLSSLSKLVQTLHVDVIKLDRAFVGQMRNPRERAVVAAVAPMAEALDLDAIAEGVEQASQVQELARLGYPLAQGYHFGRPMPAADLQATLQRAARLRKAVLRLPADSSVRRSIA